jgi:hypothetical protein
MQVPVDFVLATNIFYVASTGEMKLPPFCIPLRCFVYLYAVLHTFTPFCIPLRFFAYLYAVVYTFTPFGIPRNCRRVYLSTYLGK